MMIRSQKILRSARGAQCALRLPGICNNNPETTVWAHLNGFGKGMGMKTHDILGFPACSACHAEYDTGKNRSQYTGDALRALCETLVGLVRSGLVIVPLDPEKPASEHRSKPRAPKSERQAIPQRSKTVWAKRPLKSANTLRRKERT